MQRFLSKRFEIVERFRPSGHGFSFLGKDHWAGKTVFVKCFPQSSYQNASSFQEQLAWYHGLDHPLLSYIRYAGLTPKQDLYIIRDWYINGHVMGDGTVNKDAAASSLIAATELLRSEHIVHGRIKPSNAWIHEGGLKLLDGGVPQFDPRNLATRDFSFVAPEILSGKIPNLESDLYSVGALLYLMYSGRTLFEDSDSELLRHKCIHAEATPLSGVTDAPHKLSKVITRLVSKNPSERILAFDELLDMFSPDIGAARRAPLSGRQDELRRATTTIDSTHNHLRIVAIDGEAGTGKTRLVEEIAFRHELIHGHFLTGRSYERDNRQFEPILQVISERFKREDKPLEEWIRSDSAGFAYSLIHLLPALSHEFAVGKTTADLTTERIVADLVGTLLSMARGDPSLAIAIEDVHWADEGTILVLQQLALRCSGANLCLIITRRLHSPEPTSDQLYDGFRLPGIDLAQISLGPLDSRGVQRMAKVLTESTDDIPWVVNNSSGIPLFVEECARYKDFDSERLPPKVSDILSKKAARLEPFLKPAAQFLALFPKPVDLRFISKIVDSLPQIGEDSVEDLVRSGILVKSVRTLSFRHDGIREAIYRQMPSKRRQKFHRLIHRTLSAESSDLRSLAYHAERGEMHREAALDYETAATDNKRQNNYHAAIELFAAARRMRKKLGESSPAEVELAYAEALGSAGKTVEARKTVLRILSSIPPQTELRASAYRNLGACSRDSHDKSLRYHTFAIDHLPAGSSKLLRFRLNLAQAHSSAGNAMEARQVLETISDNLFLSEQSHLGLLAIKGSILLALCQYEPALTALRRESKQGPFSAIALNNIAVCIEHLGDLTEACGEQARALELSRKLGLLFGELQSLANLGAFETKRGNLRKAASLFEEADRFCDAMNIYREGNRTNLPLLAADRATLRMILGEYSSARRLILSATRRLKSDSTSQKASWIAFKVAAFYSLLNETTKALKALQRVQDSELYNTDFFKVERTLAICQIGPPGSGHVQDLESALQLTHKLGTLYQRCRVLIELGAARIDGNDLKQARLHLIEAQKLTTRCHYGILKPRLALLRAFATESPKSKEHYLDKAYHLASDLPLPELVAESSLYLASYHLEDEVPSKAHEYISKSVSTIETLAARVPASSRKRYLKVGWRVEARSMFKKIDSQLREAERTESVMTPPIGPLNKTLYTTTVAIAEAKDPTALAEIVRKTVSEALEGRVVVSLTVDETMDFHAKKLPIDDALAKRISKLYNTERERPYYGTESSRGKKSASSVIAMAWIPLSARNNRFGGIYVSLNARRFSEAEMEFLTSIGIIASHVLAAILWASAKPETSDQKLKIQNIVGRSRKIQEVYSQIEVAAKGNATVLIEGESGTGKELVAQAIHENSDRAKAPLITVDCGAIPDTLIESELFGSRKGSFTGATSDRAGLIEAAHKGTLFLDEISNTSPSLQIRLLRVLQEKEVRRIGDAKSRSVDIRLIAATNSNLESLVEKGQFRQDLFYRLNVLHITLPPLRKRKEDIPDIARSFLKRLNTTNKTRKRFSTVALEHLTTGNYRGNVRELQNMVERAYFLAADSNMIKEVVVASGAAGQDPDEVDSWFKDLQAGRTDFWSAIHGRYKKRDISRQKVVALMHLGLRETRGTYKAVARLFHVKDKEYRRFMDFLRRNDCLPDFRPYRRLRLE